MIAVTIGWFAGEPMDAWVFVGFAVILVGVYPVRRDHVPSEEVETGAGLIQSRLRFLCSILRETASDWSYLVLTSAGISSISRPPCIP